jgi:hypothetical protein
MKNLKLFTSAAALAAAALSIVAPAVSATVLTDSNGMTLNAGTTFNAEAEGHVVLDSVVGEVKCNSSVSGEITNAGGSTETVNGQIKTLSFTGCTDGADVTVINGNVGGLEIHTSETGANNNGTLTSSNTEVTIEIFGAHCIFKTSATDLGTVTGSKTTGGNATLDISARIPRTAGRAGALCGSSAPWTGSYKFTAPSGLNVDGETAPVELKGEVPTVNVGETLPVTWTNTGGSSVTINDETNSDGTVAETLGSGCGTIAQTSSCTSRKVKCLKKGEATLTIRNTPSITGSVVLKCDEPELAGGPPTANVGETVTVTWKNNTSGTLVIEDETVSDVTVAETLGTSCETIAAGGSCTNRKVKCLKKGESTITVADTPSVEGKFVIKCD